MNNEDIPPMGANLKKRQGERNLEASLQQRLRNHAKITGDDVALILIRYINERFLYRLSLSPDRDRFILRGATLFTLWNPEPHRATRDLDLMASGETSSEAIRRIITTACGIPVDPDGVSFLPETMHLETRTEGRAYQGFHLEMMATLGTARPRLEIDIAVGEAVVPPPLEIDLPVLLSMPSPRMQAYQKETTVAEKCEALVSLGLPNTRMKDFYDLWYLCRTFPFSGTLLADSLQATFTRRNTQFPGHGLPTALTTEFAGDPLKNRQWNAFLGKSHLAKQAPILSPVVACLREFLQPPLEALADNKPFARHWSPEAKWQDDYSGPLCQDSGLAFFKV